MHTSSRLFRIGLLYMLPPYQDNIEWLSFVLGLLLTAASIIILAPMTNAEKDEILAMEQ